jgi:hypothetical protein
MKHFIKNLMNAQREYREWKDWQDAAEVRHEQRMAYYHAQLKYELGELK